METGSELLAPCPFCAEDLAPLFAGFQTLDYPIQCVRCMAAILFTFTPDVAEHTARLVQALLEFLPPEGARCRPALRALPWLEAPAPVDDTLYIVAAWNLEEWVSGTVAARILDMSLPEAELALAAGDILGGRQGIAPRSRRMRAAWLVPRWGLLEYLDRRRQAM